MAMRTEGPLAVFVGRRQAALLLTVLASAAILAQAPQPLPNRPNSVKFAAIGDNGTGDSPQYEVAAQMVKSRASFPFEFVIMLGDNMYGSQRAADFVRKFEQPYAGLLTAGVKFQASLGNHDEASPQINYGHFNMNGQRYYSFARGNARFFALDTVVMDQKQLAWIDTSLRDAREEWKICYFHHPLYSNAARHGSQVDIRVMLEPLFVKHGVDVVFAGHDHVYERIKPQKNIVHFVSGAGGQLRRGNLRPTNETAAYFDQDRSFMLLEIVGSELHFQSVSRTGKVVDSGVITRQTKPAGGGLLLETPVPGGVR
jgi:3',5'-cyclic AMP phosphodiesterase CpdA